MIFLIKTRTPTHRIHVYFESIVYLYSSYINATFSTPKTFPSDF